MDPGDQNTSLEEFKTWKTDNLQNYLTMRGLTKEGTKDEMVALCFSAAKLGLPVKPNQSEVLLDNVNFYNRILYNCDIPDPLTLHSGWFDEKSGISKWPPTFLSDISTYLIDHGDVASLSQVLKDYKVGKSYEYFTCGWLQEVFYHPLDRDTCLLKAKCCPSQRIRNDLHNVWVCIKKSDGSIKGAYCSCTAGLGQTCNHVASLLFKLESSNRYGMGACTSSACSWVVPKKVKDMQPKLLASMPPRKSNRSKSVKSRTLMPTNRKSFNPITTITTEKGEMLSSFAIAMRGILPNACIFRGLPKDDVNEYDEDYKETEGSTGPETEDPTVPETEDPAGPETEDPTINEIDILDIFNYTLDFITSKFQSQTSCYDFLNFLPKLTDDEVFFIEKSTVGQHDNCNWFSLRKGRITASKFYQIFTKVNSIKSKSSIDSNSLIKIVMGYTSVNPNIKSLKHGRETEPIAVDNYISIYKKKHSNVTFRKCGMFVDQNNCFLSATPDLLVSCSCCGDGLLEIKCPVVPLCSDCTGFCSCHLPGYIVYKNCTFSVKQNHSYYTQVQGQIAITGRKWCDLFIFTVNGYLQQRIVLDEETFYNVLFPNLKYFFINCILPELLSPKLNSVEQPPESMEVETSLCDTQSYFCPICKNLIKESENVSKYNERSVGCDKCEMWFHFPCVKFTKTDSKKKTWFCPNCR